MKPLDREAVQAFVSEWEKAKAGELTRADADVLAEKMWDLAPELAAWALEAETEIERLRSALALR